MSSLSQQCRKRYSSVESLNGEVIKKKIKKILKVRLHLNIYRYFGLVRSWPECVICDKKVADDSVKQAFRNVKGQLFREEKGLGNIQKIHRHQKSVWESRWWFANCYWGAFWVLALNWKAEKLHLRAAPNSLTQPDKRQTIKWQTGEKEKFPLLVNWIKLF